MSRHSPARKEFVALVRCKRTRIRFFIGTRLTQARKHMLRMIELFQEPSMF